MSFEIRQGDALTLLRQMPDGIVQTCVTSPPYWWLRDYGTARWEGGGDPACDHVAPPMGGTGRETLVGTTAAENGTWRQQYRGDCGKCGARRIDAQLGIEPTPEEYVSRMVDVFRDVKRVLRDDGTLWLNLGDSYAGSGTVGVVSLRHGRRFLGMELNPTYVEMARRRIAGPLFAA